MKKKLKYVLLFILPAIFMACFSQCFFAQENNNGLEFTEIYRIEIYNKPNGQIAVSRNQGVSWEVVGRVVYPCQKINERGYTASKWAKIGAIAASAVNAIHIKVGSNKEKTKGAIFSIVPSDLLNPPEDYNSFLSPDSSIYTDITAGQSIFGGGYAPFVGNPVSYIDEKNTVHQIEQGYIPKIGHIIAITALRPVPYPRAIIFENKFGGAVTIDYGEGNEEVIGEVLKPVCGVGRFSGTQYTEAGRIRANHCGVIDVSTSKRGKIGGFQIIPSNHGMSSEMEKARTFTQWLVVGPTYIFGDPLEGTYPLFSNFLQPKYAPMNLESPTWLNDLLKRFIVDVKYAGKKDWQIMPRFWLDPDMDKPLPQWANSALKDVRYIRILFPVER
jgi:hypothetical protein